ncbi:hypothetical protein ACLKA6_010484 [Drosophila palustris]
MAKDVSYRHVPTLLNPADLASRGCDTHELIHSIWLDEPLFLCEELVNTRVDPHDANYEGHITCTIAGRLSPPPKDGAGEESLAGLDGHLNDLRSRAERFGPEVEEMALLKDEELDEVLAAAGDVDVVQDLPWEQLDWVEVPAEWRTFGLGTRIPAAVLDAVAVGLKPWYTGRRNSWWRRKANVSRSILHSAGPQ